MDIDDLYRNKLINKYFYATLLNRLDYVDDKNQLLDEAVFLSKLNIDSLDKHKLYLLVLHFCNNKNQIEKSPNVFKSILNGKYKLDTKEDVENVVNDLLTTKKMAYPIGNSNYLGSNVYNINNWINTLKTAYKESEIKNISLNDSLNELTNDWNSMEKGNFKRWVAFYGENAHQKYKTAQDYNFPLQHLQNLDSLKAKIPGINVAEISHEQKMKENDEIKKELVKKKIKSIVQRLNAAEKIITSDPEFIRDIDAGLDLRIWLEELQKLKRNVLLLPLKHSSSVDDLIIKHANICAKKGLNKVASEIRKLAQEAPQMPELPPLPPSMPAGNAPSAPSEINVENEDDVFDEIVKGMNLDSGEADDLEVEEDFDFEKDAELEVDLGEIIVEAQEAPAMPLPPPPPPVGLVPVPAPSNVEIKNESDDVFEAALSNVSINDVIERLETLVNVFRTRELSRQLSIVDILMDRLNISTFFPNLAEANAKLLETNSYVLNRLEICLSQLLGSIETPMNKKLDLTTDQTKKETPNINIDPKELQARLEQKQTEEKDKKEKAKKSREESEANKTQPEEVTKELSEPTKIEVSNQVTKPTTQV
jgi:hypothetical protein